jgi:thymidylate synthase
MEIANCTILYDEVCQYTFYNPERLINPVFHAVELMYFLNGRADDVLTAYIGDLKEFVNEKTGSFDGSYGYNIHRYLPYVFNRLIADKDTRRAVLPILDQSHMVDTPTKDMPCNNLLNFRIHDDKLCMNVVTRTNDG